MFWITNDIIFLREFIHDSFIETDFFNVSQKRNLTNI